MHLDAALRRHASALGQSSIRAAITCTENSLHLCPNTLVIQQDTLGYFWPLTGLSNFFGVTGSYRVFFFIAEKGATETRALTGLDVESIRTYWEVWGCCCWPRRCFLCPTCQRHSPSTSPSCPCGWLAGGGASDAGSSWARARRCRRCGDLWKAKTTDKVSDARRPDNVELLRCKWAKLSNFTADFLRVTKHGETLQEIMTWSAADVQK